MDDAPLRVLLVEDNPGDADLLAELLTQAGADSLVLIRVEQVSQALSRLRGEHFDAVLLDLGLPDCQGLETFTRIHEGEPGTPILVLTGLDDRGLSSQAVRRGAQDYLLKGKVTSELLVRSIRHAIERQRRLAEVASHALFDELTGLYNRRGMLTVAAPLFKGVGRMKKGMTLLFIDLDNMKRINDTLGHKAGDQALIDTAEILRETFRGSDVVARLGGDEFAVLALGATVSGAPLLAVRLEEQVGAHNARGRRPYELSLSVGMAHADHEHPCSLESLLARADGLMYQQKQARRAARAAEGPAALARH